MLIHKENWVCYCTCTLQLNYIQWKDYNIWTFSHLKYKEKRSSEMDLKRSKKDEWFWIQKEKILDFGLK